MNLRDLAYLVAVAESRHFGRAAEICNVSQPTLSGQIRKLEESLGIALFERDSRNVALTEGGMTVVAEARAALAHVAAMRDLASTYRDPLSGPFRLGVIASLGPFLAPDLLAQLEHDAPRLAPVVVEDLTAALLGALRGHELDAAILATAPDGHDLTEDVLFDEPFLLAHAPDHPLAAIPAPMVGDLAGGKLLLLSEGHCLRNQALAVCGTAAVDQRLKASSLLTLMRVAAAGHGATLVPKLAARWAEGLMLRRVDDPAMCRRVRLVARRNFPRLGALELIAGTARSIAAAGLPAVERGKGGRKRDNTVGQSLESAVPVAPPTPTLPRKGGGSRNRT